MQTLHTYFLWASAGRQQLEGRLSSRMEWLCSDTKDREVQGLEMLTKYFKIWNDNEMKIDSSSISLCSIGSSS